MTTSSVANVEAIARWGHNIDELEEHDSWATEWADCKAAGEVWGGRSRGGRGVRVNRGILRDIHVEGLTMEFSGQVLLERCTLNLIRGHRYGLVGSNGSGK